MPKNYPETRMDAGFAAISDALKSASLRQSRRGLSDAAIRVVKPLEKANKIQHKRPLSFEEVRALLNAVPCMLTSKYDNLISKLNDLAIAGNYLYSID